MTPVVVAGIWLALGVAVSFLAGGGIGRAAHRSCSSKRKAPKPVVTQPRTFVTMSSLDWVREADAVATGELLSLRPGTVRQVPAR